MALLLLSSSQLLAQFLVQVYHQLTQTVLLLVSYPLVIAVLQFHRGLRFAKMPQVGLQLGDLPAYIALGEYQLVIVVAVLLSLVLLISDRRLLRFGFMGGGREQGAEEGPFDLILLLVRDIVRVEFDQLLKLGLYFANIQIFFHQSTIIIIRSRL